MVLSTWSLGLLDLLSEVLDLPLEVLELPSSLPRQPIVLVLVSQVVVYLEVSILSLAKDLALSSLLVSPTSFC